MSKIEFIFTLVMIAIIGSTLLYTIYKDNRIARDVLAKYSNILLKDSINGVVKSTYLPDGWRGGSIGQYVTLKSCENIFIDTKEFITPGFKDIRMVLKPDSRIIKKSYSDTMYIYYKRNKYSIIINLE